MSESITFKKAMDWSSYALGAANIVSGLVTPLVTMLKYQVDMGTFDQLVRKEAYQKAIKAFELLKPTRAGQFLSHRYVTSFKSIGLTPVLFSFCGVALGAQIGYHIFGGRKDEGTKQIYALVGGGLGLIAGTGLSFLLLRFSRLDSPLLLIDVAPFVYGPMSMLLGITTLATVYSNGHLLHALVH